jgi:hypothetical protein
MSETETQDGSTDTESYDLSGDKTTRAWEHSFTVHDHGLKPWEELRRGIRAYWDERETVVFDGETFNIRFAHMDVGEIDGAAYSAYHVYLEDGERSVRFRVSPVVPGIHDVQDGATRFTLTSRMVEPQDARELIEHVARELGTEVQFG